MTKKKLDKLKKEFEDLIYSDEDFNYKKTEFKKWLDDNNLNKEMTQRKIKVLDEFREDRKKVNLEIEDEIYYVTLYYDGTAKVIDTTIETDDGSIFEDEEIYDEIMNYLEKENLL